MNQAIEIPPPVKQPLSSRLFWFGVGGVISVALNAIPFRWMSVGLQWPEPVCYAISLLLVTVIFAIWNYYINFRTTRGLGECTTRYLICIGVCLGINYGLVVPAMKVWGELAQGWGWLLIIATVQVGMGGVKFFIYHFWVYPAVSDS